MSGSNIYNKIAKKYREYNPDLANTYFYQNGNPEDLFEQKIKNIASTLKVALDTGCGDGRFTLNLAPYFKHICGIDNSVEMIKLAQKNKLASISKNIDFTHSNLDEVIQKGEKFDVVYSRRGPYYYDRLTSLLSKNSVFLEIGIGYNDGLDLKKVLGKGQGYNKWNSNLVQTRVSTLIDLGFNVYFSETYKYETYYNSIDSLINFLEQSPMISNFNSNNDKDIAGINYFSKVNSTKKGIRLIREKFIINARRIN